MDALNIGLIAVAIIVAIALLAYCYLFWRSACCSQASVAEPKRREPAVKYHAAPTFQYETETDSKPVPKKVSSLINSISSETGLKISKKVCDNVTLNEACRIKHMNRSKLPLDKARAVAISERRPEHLRDGTEVDLNTVFEWPEASFHAFETETGEEVIVSGCKVNTFQCTKKEDGTWEAVPMGKCYAVFRDNHCLYKKSLRSSDRIHG